MHYFLKRNAIRAQCKNKTILIFLNAIKNKNKVSNFENRTYLKASLYRISNMEETNARPYSVQQYRLITDRLHRIENIYK